MSTFNAIVLALALCMCLFWAYQFIELMLLSEADFPGKHDKSLWVAAFIFVFLIAPFAFLGWKPAYRAMRSAQADLPHEGP